MDVFVAPSPDGQEDLQEGAGGARIGKMFPQPHEALEDQDHQ